MLVDSLLLNGRFALQRVTPASQKSSLQQSFYEEKTTALVAAAWCFFMMSFGLQYHLGVLRDWLGWFLLV